LGIIGGLGGEADASEVAFDLADGLGGDTDASEVAFDLAERNCSTDCGSTASATAEPDTSSSNLAVASPDRGIGKVEFSDAAVPGLTLLGGRSACKLRGSGMSHVPQEARLANSSTFHAATASSSMRKFSLVSSETHLP
jgi:hypothetical protein